VRDKFIHIEEAIYTCVYFSFKYLDRHFIVSLWMFDSMLAVDTEEGTVVSILIEFHQSYILKVCSILFSQKILSPQPSSRICHNFGVLQA
jgi:hypothetical protein